MLVLSFLTSVVESELLDVVEELAEVDAKKTTSIFIAGLLR